MRILEMPESRIEILSINQQQRIIQKKKKSNKEELQRMCDQQLAYHI